MKTPTRKSFSIIELMLVAAVLMLLAAVIISNMARMKEYAKQTACISNLRQVGLGYRSYFFDFDNQMPMIERWLDDLTPSYRYVQNLNVFICPGTNKPPLVSTSQLCGATSYLCSGKISDVEKNCNYNNGHGNNPYHFDPSNKSKPTQAIMAAKKDDRVLYDSRWDAHLGGLQFNVLYLDDLHHEFERGGVASYWTLDSKGWLETSLNPFPPLP